MRHKQLVPLTGSPDSLINALTDLKNRASSRPLKESRRGQGERSTLDRRPYLTVLMDATGSMQDLWNQTRAVITKAVNRAAELAPGVTIEWVAYRDYDSGADPLMSSGVLKDPEALARFIGSLECTGGDDGSGDGRAEALEVALRYAADASAHRVIVIGDAPAHRERDWALQASRLALLRCPVHAFLVETWRDADLETARVQFGEIARRTGGTFHVLAQDAEALAHVIATTAVAGRDLKLLVEYERRFLPRGEAGRYLKELLRLGPAKGTGP